VQDGLAEAQQRLLEGDVHGVVQVVALAAEPGVVPLLPQLEHNVAGGDTLSTPNKPNVNMKRAPINQSINQSIIH
jgi:hypothetical protein